MIKPLDDLRFSHLVVGVTDGHLGRVVGGLVGGVMLELLSLGDDGGRPTSKSIVGNQNISLSVADLDDTYRSVREAGYEPDQSPFEIAGVRMFFVRDPDGTAMEFIEYPGAAWTSEELHRGTR